MIVDTMIMSGTRRPHLVVKLRAVEQSLAHLQKVRLAFHFETELLADHARPAIATDQVLGADRNRLTVRLSDLRRNAVRLFRVRQQFMAESHRQIWNPFGHRFEQWLERVLGDDLIGFERHRAVCGGIPPRLGWRHGGMGHLEQRWPHEIEHQISVHRPVRRISRSAHGIGETEATENLHRPRIAALHFRVAERRIVFLDQDAADAALTEIDAERQPDWAGPDDKNFRVHVSHTVPTFMSRQGREAAQSTVAPERLTISPQRTISERTNACNSSIELLSAGTSPMRAMAFRVSGNAMMASSAACNLSTIGLGVAPGATTICHAAALKPGTPRSAIGARLGMAAARVFVVTPNARILPAWISGTEDVKSVNMTCMRPPIRST